MKNIQKILAEIDLNFKQEYGIVLSVLPYATYYNKSTIEEEIRKRVLIYRPDEIEAKKLTTIAINELDDIYINKMKRLYGQNDNIKYKFYNIDRRMLEDSCKGMCLINSLKSHEYLDMNNKEFGTKLKNILKLINDNLINNEKYNDNTFESIVNDEQAKLLEYKQNKYKEKVVNYIPLIKKWKEIVEKEESKILVNTVQTNIEIKKEFDSDFISEIQDIFPDRNSMENLYISKNVNSNEANKEKNVERNNDTENEFTRKIIGEMIGYRMLADYENADISSIKAMGHYYLDFFQDEFINLKDITDNFNQRDKVSEHIKNTIQKKKPPKKSTIDNNFKFKNEFETIDFFKNVIKGYVLIHGNQSEWLDFIINCNYIIKNKDPLLALDSNGLEIVVKYQQKQEERSKIKTFVVNKENSKTAHEENIFEKVIRVVGINRLILVGKEAGQQVVDAGKKLLKMKQ